MKKIKNKQIMKNTLMLMIFNISKIIFPFITLPYLTRILSTDIYGTVTYVKTVMTYMQIFVDFGFVLSATKDIVKAKDSDEKLGKVIADTMVARILLGILGFIIICMLIMFLPILKANALFTILSYIVVFLSIFLMDFLFRGLEKMHIITIRFMTMKIISTILTFIFVKGDNNVLFIPILDILSSMVAILLVFFEVKKLSIKISFSGFNKAIKSIRESFVYFLSNVAATSFNTISTIIMGIYMTTTDIAYWGICMQVIGTIQACYTPISDGIYPEMIKNKNLKLIKKILKIFLPIVFLGCVFSYFIAEKAFWILGGEKYLDAVPIFRILIPTLFFDFPAVIFGWPTLGAIGKVKETTTSTVISIISYLIIIILLVLFKCFNIINLAIARTVTEIILFSTRYYFYRKNKYLFNEKNGNGGSI